nr:MAG TPA: hypothetical protein [Caudoviricetes sp.]
MRSVRRFSYGLLIKFTSVSRNLLSFQFCIEEGFVLAFVACSDMVDAWFVPDELADDLDTIFLHSVLKLSLSFARMEDIHWSSWFECCCECMKGIL